MEGIKRKRHVSIFMSFVEDVDFLILQEMDAPTLRNIFLLSKTHYEYLNTHTYALKLKAEKIKEYKNDLQYKKCKKLASFVILMTVHMKYAFLQTDLHDIRLKKKKDLIAHEYYEIIYGDFPKFQYEDQEQKLEKVRTFFDKEHGCPQKAKTIKEIIADALYIVMDQRDDYRPLLSFTDNYLKNDELTRTECEEHRNKIFYNFCTPLHCERETFWRSILFNSTLCDKWNDSVEGDDEDEELMERLDIDRYCIYWELSDLFKKPMSFWGNM